MTDKRERSPEGEIGSELERRLRMGKRRFVRILLASAATYSVPLMASFSMEGMRLGRAQAQSSLPPGFAVANQTPAVEHNPFLPVSGPFPPGQGGAPR